MTVEPKVLIDEYLAWLRNRIDFEKIGDAFEITTPFLDRHNDRIQIYVYPHGSGLRLSDDGYTIADLTSSGCGLDTPRQRAMLETMLNGFGVKEKDGTLFVDSSLATIGPKKQR